MVQCSVCLKSFTSKRYLTTHLHYSQSCLSAMTTVVGATPSNRMSERTILDTNHQASSSTSDVLDLLQNVEIVCEPVATNALGDVILLGHDDNSSSSSNEFPLPENDDDNDNPMAATEDHHDPSTNTNNSITNQKQMEGMLSSEPRTILPLESFNVPAYVNENVIPMLKMMMRVRNHGAPLKMVDEISSDLKEEWQAGRLDGTYFCTDRTAMRQISAMYPCVPSPIPITITHERTLQEIRVGADRPSLTFPVFSFLGQLNDLLNDHVFSDINNLVVDPSKIDLRSNDSTPNRPSRPRIV